MAKAQDQSKATFDTTAPQVRLRSLSFHNEY